MSHDGSLNRASNRITKTLAVTSCEKIVRFDVKIKVFVMRTNIGQIIPEKI